MSLKEIKAALSVMILSGDVAELRSLTDIIKNIVDGLIILTGWLRLPYLTIIQPKGHITPATHALRHAGDSKQ